jgi:hypothetical protein
VDTAPSSQTSQAPVEPRGWKYFCRCRLKPWQEETLARVVELQAVAEWAFKHSVRHPGEELDKQELKDALNIHLKSAEDAARRRYRTRGNSQTIQKAMVNLYAAEAHLINFAPCTYVLGQMPSLLNHVQRHLSCDDPRRREFERTAKNLGIIITSYPDSGTARPAASDSDASESEHRPRNPDRIIEENRGRIVAAVRAAGSAGLREQSRISSFRNAVVATTVVMFILAVGIGILGVINPRVVPLCFEPEARGVVDVVCPLERSRVEVSQRSDSESQGQQISLARQGQEPSPQQGDQANPTPQEIDQTVAKTVQRADLLTVELVGLTAASIVVAAAIRHMRGSSEPYALPVALALLKLPTGAVTAFLGLLLMRGGFVPGLSALDTPAQILAWAATFGVAQQLFTRFVDQQAGNVLGTVRRGERSRRTPDQPEPSQSG